MTATSRHARHRLLVPLAVAALAAGTAACETNAPAPGDQLDVDGESPLITDPGGVGNQITNDEFDDDDGLRD